MATEAPPILEVDDIAKHFARRDGMTVGAVSGVSCTVGQGEMVVVVGPSGCGKTTLLRCVAGLERPSSGRISIGGRLASSAADHVFLNPEDRNLGMMFQSYALWPHMSIFDNIAYPLRVRKYRREDIRPRVLRLLDLAGIRDLENEFPGRLSGGQQQRVALARSLVADPQIVLFDEPLSNVDAKLREGLRLEILQLQRELGFGALYVTHDQDEAMQIADRLVVLNAGKIAQQGTPQEIYEKPASRYVAAFIGSTNQFCGNVASIDSATDRAVIAIQDGRLELPARGLGVGQAVCVMIRPNHAVLQPAAAAPPCNVWNGTVRRRMFLGTHLAYFIQFRQQTIQVATDDAVSFREGDAISVRFPAERLMVFA